MLGAEMGGAIAELHEEHFVVGLRELANGFFPGVGLGELWLDALDLVGEFVVEEFVEKDLGDDLVFVAVIAEAVVGADGFEIINEGGGLELEVAGHFGRKAENLKC